MLPLPLLPNLPGVVMGPALPDEKGLKTELKVLLVAAGVCSAGAVNCRKTGRTATAKFKQCVVHLWWLWPCTADCPVLADINMQLHCESCQASTQRRSTAHTEFFTVRISG
jgi:hypothetical protein